MADQKNHSTQRRQDGRMAELSETERLVITSVCLGLRNRQIADLIGLTENEVKEHLASIYRKLTISDRLELIIHAFRHGLAPLHPAE